MAGNEDWLGTDRFTLNITDRQSFAKYWQPGAITAFLAEHVWEHLDDREAAAAFQNVYEFLKPGGYLRLAVPDGFNPDPKYIDHVRVGGDNLYHKQLYNYRQLIAQAVPIGFEVKLLEYFDETGQLHLTEWNPIDGNIRRSSVNKKRLQDKSISLMADLVKPGVPQLLRSAELGDDVIVDRINYTANHVFVNNFRRTNGQPVQQDQPVRGND